MFLPLTSQIQGNLSMPPPADPNNFTRFVPTAMHPQVANLFSAGDLRTNEQVMLISWHTLFLREHNRLVTVVTNNLNQDGNTVECVPESEDQRNQLIAPTGCELIYQLARRVNIAQWQKVVFDEYFGTWHSDNPAQPSGPNSLSISYLAVAATIPRLMPTSTSSSRLPPTVSVTLLCALTLWRRARRRLTRSDLCFWAMLSSTLRR